ncbi:MAG: FMN-binding negative transcriptional regulator [Acidobacteria bacterium]|nr:FMN-binding negative transcriptional regulator [Acidobacteriota bacterium]
MFVRSCWKPRAEQELWSFIEAYPWGLLVNNGSSVNEETVGELTGPYATNLPLILDRSGSKPMLIGHLAEGNEHALALRSTRSQSLAIFEGPVSYVTASWYPGRDMPSTYYYTAVHCYGRVRIQDKAALQRSLEVLTERMESQYKDGWKIDEVPASEITRRLPYIMGFELEIERIEGKFKLGQDEPKRDAMAVGCRLAQSEDGSDRELARMVLDYNRDRSEA